MVSVARTRLSEPGSLVLPWLLPLFDQKKCDPVRLYPNIWNPVASKFVYNGPVSTVRNKRVYKLKSSCDSHDTLQDANIITEKDLISVL